MHDPSIIITRHERCFCFCDSTGQQYYLLATGRDIDGEGRRFTVWAVYAFDGRTHDLRYLGAAAERVDGTLEWRRGCPTERIAHFPQAAKLVERARPPTHCVADMALRRRLKRHHDLAVGLLVGEGVWDSEDAEESQRDFRRALDGEDVEP